MERIFFTLMMMSSMSLMALPNEPLSLQESFEKTMDQRDNLDELSTNRKENFSTILNRPEIRRQRGGKCCKPGLLGPTGPTGPTGPIGPIGPTGPLITAYGSTFTESTATVGIGDAIPFGGGTIANNNVIYDPFAIEISENGDYFVTFGVSTSTVGGRFQLQASGISVPGAILNTVIANQMTTGSAIVHLPFDGVSLSLVNISGDPITLGSNTVGGVTAFITVERLHDPLTP